MVALAAVAGLGPELLAACWPHEQEIIEAIVLEADEVRSRERADQATKIRNEVKELLDASMP